MAEIGKLRKVESNDNIEHYMFYCPGCECYHGFKVPDWTFNGDFEKPTVSPSLLSIGEKRCHLFMKEGKLQFLNDCQHKFAGQTIDMENEEPNG